MYARSNQSKVTLIADPSYGISLVFGFTLLLSCDLEFVPYCYVSVWLGGRLERRAGVESDVLQVE